VTLTPVPGDPDVTTSDDGVWHPAMSSPVLAQDRVVAGRYRLRRVVGRGGMGVLWAARDEMLGRDVAVKEMRPPLGTPREHDPVARERVLREARAAARVTHPSAVTIYDVVEEDGLPWIVMELLPPRTLADVLAVDGPLAPPAVARIGLDLLDALTAAHAAGVVHRDVKPGNVLLAEERAVLVDFGIAMVDGDASLTSTGLLLGSPAFMAPERARGEQPTPASDLWSLGATLFTAVEGDSPFRRDGQLPTLAAVVTQDAPPAEHAGALRPVLAGLLARDPADRPTAAEARADLVAALAADAEPPTAAVGADLDDDTPYDDTPYDDIEPTVEAAMDDELDQPAVAPLVPPPAAAGSLDAQRWPSIPRPRRAGALAVALLAPVGLFALALSWPMGRADPITRAPQAVVTSGASTSTTRSATPVRPAAATSRTRARAATIQRGETSRTASSIAPTGEGKHQAKGDDEKKHAKQKHDDKNDGETGGGEEA
jgi:eukaryotic-like serine/threonine-protein kinase